MTYTNCPRFKTEFSQSRVSITSAPDCHHHHLAEVPKENNRPRSQRNPFSFSRCMRSEFAAPRVSPSSNDDGNKKELQRDRKKKGSRSQKEWSWRYRILASLCMFCLLAKVIYGSPSGFSSSFAANYVARLRLISSKSLIVSPDTTRFDPIVAGGLAFNFRVKSTPSERANESNER